MSPAIVVVAKDVRGVEKRVVIDDSGTSIDDVRRTVARAYGVAVELTRDAMPPTRPCEPREGVGEEETHAAGGAGKGAVVRLSLTCPWK